MGIGKWSLDDVLGARLVVNILQWPQVPYNLPNRLKDQKNGAPRNEPITTLGTPGDQ